MAKFTRKDFLGALFQDYFRKREGFIMVKSSRHLDQKTSIRYFPNTEILAKEPYQPDQHVFFGVCPHENMRPEKSHIQHLVALWAGLDLSPEGYSGKQTYFFGQSQAAKAIRSFPLPPSIIVESGWGVHLYWLLREVRPITDVEALERLLGKINSYFQCKTDVGIDSMLRLPDTVNAKVSAHTTECRIKYINPDFRYDFTDMEHLNLGATASLSKSAVFLRPILEGAPDIAMVAQAEAESVAASASYSSSEEARENMVNLGLASQESKNVQPQARSEKNRNVVGQNGLALSVSEPDIEPLPYENAGRRLDVLPHLQSGNAMSEEVLDRVADKLADKIAQKISDKLVDQIVDKVVERLIVPR